MDVSRGTWLVVGALAAGLMGYLLLGNAAGASPAAGAGSVRVSAPVSWPAPVLPRPSVSSPPQVASRVATQTQSEPDPQRLSKAERIEVERFAVRFLTTLARPGRKVSYQQWWNRVAGMLTDDAVDTYAGITPAALAIGTVTGPVTLEPVDPNSDAFWVQPVTVGTDAGAYRLLVQLESSGFADRLLIIEIQQP